MKRAPKKWKSKVKKKLKDMGMSERSAEAAVKTVWKDGMKAKCRAKVIKKYKKQPKSN